MIQAIDDGSATTAVERTQPRLRPTIYRPTRPSVTRVMNGEEIEAEVFRGSSLSRAGIDPRELSRAGSDVVAIRVPALDANDLVELRIPRAYTESTRGAAGEQTGWKSHGRLANSVMLPHGWFLIQSSVATIVSQTGDGRTRIEFDAPADGAPEVVLTVQRT